MNFDTFLSFPLLQSFVSGKHISCQAFGSSERIPGLLIRNVRVSFASHPSPMELWHRVPRIPSSTRSVLPGELDSAQQLLAKAKRITMGCWCSFPHPAKKGAIGTLKFSGQVEARFTALFTVPCTLLIKHECISKEYDPVQLPHTLYQVLVSYAAAVVVSIVTFTFAHGRSHSFGRG